jgi:hypothetical protein
MADVPYQQQTQVDQAEAELANAKALGLTDRQAAAEKTLESLGAKKKAAVKRAESKSDEDADEARAKAPEGRSSAPRSKA